MNSEKAREILTKYWNCETSPEEEVQLGLFFTSGDIPEDLKKFAPLFSYFRQESKVTLPVDAEQRLLNRIQEKNRRFSLSFLYKVAAAILLILSFYFIHQRYTEVREKAAQVLTDTYADPEKALEETKKVLLSVSERLNRGMREATRISKFNKAEEVIKNAKDKEI